MDDEQQRRPSGGSVAHAFGNALARQWAAQMPRPLIGGFLTTLYAVRQLASADGRLRYERDGAAITLGQISSASRCDLKDTRVYLQAAVAAGVLAVVEDGHGRGRTRGRAVMYALLLCPAPDWERAAGLVWIAQQQKKERRAAAAARKAAQPADTSGDSAPTSESPTSGDSAPRSAEEGWGDSAPTQVGGQSPEGVGAQCPDHPGSTHVLPHEVAEVVPQPQDAHGHASEKTIPQQPDKAHRRCAGGCGQRVIRSDRMLCAGCERRAKNTRETSSGPVQGAFMISLPSGAPPGPRRAPQASPGSWPQADAFAPLRTCDCGREYRAASLGRCPDCLDAASRERSTGTG
ncbi:hypothetical protein [Streptomyces sp. WAC01280]|uniref:hypothetical protein n=1 Tax=Streptomyces sp. WAC01280 TaxID=2487424 RepID=UPI000F798834|nr:hypothetical protein [Streptomyces sp. WAC01280]RSS51387.1 hypothetical protein EF909_34405 [Streptomyces sp. WAC01280]